MHVINHIFVLENTIFIKYSDIYSNCILKIDSFPDINKTYFPSRNHYCEQNGKL